METIIKNNQGISAQKMIAPIQSTLVAQQAYAINDLFIYNGFLYKATSAIQSGGTIIINSNCIPAAPISFHIATLRIQGTVIKKSETLAAGSVTDIIVQHGISVDHVKFISGFSIAGDARLNILSVSLDNTYCHMTVVNPNEYNVNAEATWAVNYQ